MELRFLTQGGETLPSVRFRVAPQVAAQRQAGIDASWRPLPKSFVARAFFYLSPGRVKVLVLQKKLVAGWEIARLRRKCELLVYDFDDAVWTEHPSHAPGPRLERKKARNARRFRRLLRAVDLAVAGNHYLGAYARRFAARVEVLPTPIDTAAYVPPERSGQGLPVVGWMGTSSNLFFLPPMLDELAPLAGKVRVRVVSDADFEHHGELEVAGERWSPEGELAALQRFDIGLMPLTSDEYTRGKCGFKLLQYMACGVVPVASDVGFNREIVRHGENGFLVNEPGQWREFVERLAADPALRAEMAAQARADVVERFDVSGAAVRLRRILHLGEFAQD